MVCELPRISFRSNIVVSVAASELDYVERLDQVFEIFGRRAIGKTCPAIDGILEEGAEILDEFKGAPAWMQACLLQLRPWNTMKFPATEPSSGGQNCWA